MTIHIPAGFSNGHIIYSLSSDPEEMTTAIGFSSAPGTTPEEEADIFAASLSTGGIVLAAVMCNQYTYKGVRVERMTSTGMLVTDAVRSTVGTMAGGCLPSNCAHLVDKITGNGGRQFRGRMFFPPLFVVETAIDHMGNMAASSAGDLTSTFEMWRLAMVAGGIPPVLFHSNPALTPTLITGFRFQQQIATQRERMR